MLENHVDVIEAAKILGVHPETVKRLIREGKLAATKFGNKWIMERDRLRVFANTYDGRRGRARRLLRADFRGPETLHNPRNPSTRASSSPILGVEELITSSTRLTKERKPMKILQETLEATLMEIVAEEDSVGRLDELKATIAETIPDIAESTAESMLAKIKDNAAAGLKEKWDYQQQFEERLRKHWGQSLELLNLFIALATEAGDEFNKTFRDEAASSNDAVFRALTLLHARACQVASATLVLLRSGYADDAHARWRALHEIAVVALFVSERGRAVAERYLLHDTVQRYKLALKHRRHAKAIQEEPITQREFEELKAQRDKLVARFGTPFKGDYGWAASTLGKKRPTIADIEDSVDLEHWRPYYGMASDNVHANAHGAYYRLGSSLRPGEILLAGPSNAGLADPGHSTAISLNQITTVLLATKPTLDNIVISNILLKLVDEIGGAFLQAHMELEALEAASQSPDAAQCGSGS